MTPWFPPSTTWIPIRYVTELNFQSYGCSVVVNSKWWGKLPAWAKKALEDSAMEAMKWHEAMFAGYGE